MKRSFQQIDDLEDMSPPTKQQKLNNNPIECINYPIKAVLLSDENDNLCQYLSNNQTNNSHKAFKYIPHIYASLKSKQQGLVRKCSNQNFKLLNIYTTTTSKNEQKNIHLNMHWMDVSKLLYSELITKKYYKPFNIILNGASLLIYYLDIRDINIEYIRNANYNPKKMASKNKLNKVWTYWTLNKLIFSLSICKLSSPKQLFIIFNGLQNDQILKEIRKRKEFMQENYSENILKTNKINPNEVIIFRNKWLSDAKDYIQTLLFSYCGWNKDKVKFLTIPILNGENNEKMLKTFYQNKIFDHITIPHKINDYYCTKTKINTENLKIIVSEHFIQSKTKYLVLIGYIYAGSIRVTQTCTVYPLKQRFNVLSMQTMDGIPISYASIGECVGICTDIQINYRQYNVPKIITDLYDNNIVECGLDFKYCYVNAIFYWNKNCDSDLFDVKIGKQLLLQCCNQRSIAKIVGIQLSYSTCPILKTIHKNINKYINNNNYNNKVMLFIERLIVSYAYEITNSYYCNDDNIVSIKPCISKINVCIQLLCDLTGIVMDRKSKPCNQFTLLSDTQIVAKGKILQLTQ